MKRFLIASVSLLLLCLLWPQSAGAQSLQDFQIRSFEADYYLDRNDQKTSTVRVVETIKAEFPSFNQNHGIERALPEEYLGNTVSLKVESVKRADGTDWPVTTRSENNNLILRIGDKDK